MSTSTAKKSEWFRERCEDGCQICAIKFPHLPNNGLQFAHIVSKTEGGGDSKINCLALCPNCEKSFDITVKRGVYRALKRHTNGKVPESWQHGEGRASEGLDLCHRTTD